jgi:hypothetical protein
MISELNDEEILDFLMNSDFEGDFKPEEFRYLLHKWKYFYRILSGRAELAKVNHDGEIRQLISEKETLSKSLFDTQVASAQKEDTINTMKSRKLTLKERWSGKIILNEDENK